MAARGNECRDPLAELGWQAPVENSRDLIGVVDLREVHQENMFVGEALGSVDDFVKMMAGVSPRRTEPIRG